MFSLEIYPPSKDSVFRTLRHLQVQGISPTVQTVGLASVLNTVVEDKSPHLLQPGRLRQHQDSQLVLTESAEAARTWTSYRQFPTNVPWVWNHFTISLTHSRKRPLTNREIYTAATTLQSLQLLSVSTRSLLVHWLEGVRSGSDQELEQHP